MISRPALLLLAAPAEEIGKGGIIGEGRLLRLAHGVILSALHRLGVDIRHVDFVGGQILHQRPRVVQPFKPAVLRLHGLGVCFSGRLNRFPQLGGKHRAVVPDDVRGVQTPVAVQHVLVFLIALPGEV